MGAQGPRSLATTYTRLQATFLEFLSTLGCKTTENLKLGNAVSRIPMAEYLGVLSCANPPSN